MRQCTFKKDPFLANFNHKATYRRQTMNILLRHVGFIWLLVICLKHTFFEKFKISKNIFGLFFFFTKKKIKNKYTKKYFAILIRMSCLYVSLPFRNSFQIQNRLKFTLTRSQLKSCGFSITCHCPNAKTQKFQLLFCEGEF